jgi:hypothetical protein
MLGEVLSFIPIPFLIVDLALSCFSMALETFCKLCQQMKFLMVEEIT